MGNETEKKSLTSAFFEAAFNEGALRFFPDHNAALFRHTAQPGDTLLGIASVHRTTMNIENPANAAYALAYVNGLIPENGRWQDVRLQIGQNITIPVARGMEIVQVPTYEGLSSKDIVSNLEMGGRLPSPLEASPNKAETIIDALNPGLKGSITGLANNSFMGPVPRTVLALVRDDFDGITPIENPGIVQGAKTALYITEPQTEHMTNVLEFARGYSRALTADGAMPPTILAYAENDFGSVLNPLRALAENPQKGDYLIFNHSYRRDFTSVNETFTNPDYRDLKTIHVLAAGNEAADIDWDAKQNVAIAFQLSPLSYIVGAAHPVPIGGVHLADYSSYGADIVAPPLALLNGEDAAGTSYAAPMMAALNQKMLEIYGGTLTQEEIMAAAYMSTTMSITEDNLNRAVALYGFDNADKPVDTVFTTNGGGRPHSDRAGAGLIEPEQWQENLNIMAGIKMRMEHIPPTINQTHDVGKITPVESRSILGERVYTYLVPVTEDMTLDRMALILPRKMPEGVSPDETSRSVTVTSPSGFVFDMPATPLGTVGTSAFALEDVKQGQFLTITTYGQPLADNAQIIVNAHADGNVIQATRDTLMEMGRMPQPNTEYAGMKLKADVDAEAAAARAALEKDSLGGLVLPPDSTMQNILSNPINGVLPPTPLPNIKF